MSRTLDAAADAALAIAGIESAAIFLVGAGTDGGLTLAGAAGIGGAALDGLVAAVGNPAHPIRRAVSDPEPTFDVTPMNPGGPRLRSHLPLRNAGGSTVGVLAVAHDAPLGSDERESLEALATAIAAEETQ